jgi:hypothetical protein
LVTKRAQLRQMGVNLRTVGHDGSQHSHFRRWVRLNSPRWAYLSRVHAVETDHLGSVDEAPAFCEIE